jgi:hypothetical protein
MHKNGIGSYWIWAINSRSADRIAANENVAEMHSPNEV